MLLMNSYLLFWARPTTVDDVSVASYHPSRADTSRSRIWSGEEALSYSLVEGQIGLSSLYISRNQAVTPVIEWKNFRPRRPRRAERML